MTESLQGRTVVVTGGSGALGRAVVARLLAAGASPVVTYRSERELSESAFTAAVRTQRVDAGDEGAVRALYRGVPGLWASVHLVGAFTMAPIAETSAADFRKMFEVNAVTCFLCCREAVVAMRSAGSGGGRIVNVAARPVVSPAGGVIAYGASKAAVASVTQSLAEEVRAEGILVNAVLPSVMDTPANRASMPGADYGKWPKVEEVAEAIAFLISPANSLTTGALVPVYGRA